MQVIDTHIHLYADEYQGDRKSLIDQALKAGVKTFLLPNIDLDSVAGMETLCREYPGVCLPMMGLHPCYVNAGVEQQLAEVRSLLESGTYVAVGEIGMDKHWSLEFIQQQEHALRTQLTWAHEFDLPVALHTRSANDEVISILRDLNLPGLRGVFHCFSGSIEQAQAMIDLGFYLGIGGVITYKNAGIDRVIASIGLDHVVLETDGPYLAPVPHRGKRNQPGYLLHILEKTAEVIGITPQQAAEITSKNATDLFRL
ncbi:MAG: TatD family hydrolase [Bacteroidota bacterium]